MAAAATAASVAAAAEFGASFGAATAAAVREGCCTAPAALAVGMAAAAMFAFGVAFMPSIDAAVTKEAGSFPDESGGGIGVTAAELPTELAAEASVGLGSLMVASVLVDWSDIVWEEFCNFFDLTGESL